MSTTPSFNPKYASAVYAADGVIAELRKRIADAERDLREWERKREHAIRLAEKTEDES